ncbi:hypothetical protein CEXT_24161 [Caerostris extrusa]|uniref:Uncharacterized protein n=1 Tax=Caerostris extrusa TaxID=172846 RepID=A0AAV4S222_CAEEX|nr:hypothetical protein CEXT_24161 [Caerostris extrusa]
MQACVLRRSNKRLSMDRRLCKICDRSLKSSYSLYCRYCFPIIKQQSKNENLSGKQCEISSTSQNNLETGCASKKSEVPPSETTNDQFDKLSVGAFQTSSSRMISKRKTSAKSK